MQESHTRKAIHSSKVKGEWNAFFRFKRIFPILYWFFLRGKKWCWWLIGTGVWAEILYIWRSLRILVKSSETDQGCPHKRLFITFISEKNIFFHFFSLKLFFLFFLVGFFPNGGLYHLFDIAINSILWINSYHIHRGRKKFHFPFPPRGVKHGVK